MKERICRVNYKNYLLFLLVLVGVVANLERFVFSLVLDPIKNELSLTDTQLGLMTGLAFSAFYAIAGIPIARWADRGNRATITALAVGVSGLMVSLSGLVVSFVQLLAVRAFVGIGEAGVVPAAHSLIADYFNRRSRPRAMGIYVTFYTLSMIVGYWIGGWLVDSYGWRTTFILIGIPGVIMAVIVRLTLREPRLVVEDKVHTEVPSAGKTFRLLWQQRTFRQILILFCLGYFFNAGISQWLPTFLLRSYGMSLADVGFWLAISFGGFGTLGIYLGGYLASRYAANQERLQMRCLAASIIGYGILSSVAYLSSYKHISLACIALGSTLLMINNGPVFAAIQSLVNDRIRSVAIAVTFLFGNLIGFGFGPLLLGFLSDCFEPYFGENALRYAMLAFCPGTLLIGFYYWKVSTTIEEDILAVELGQEVQAGAKTVTHDCASTGVI